MALLPKKAWPFNVWIRQPLFAAKLYDAEYQYIEYIATMDGEGPPKSIEVTSNQVEVGPIHPSTSNK